MKRVTTAKIDTAKAAWLIEGHSARACLAAMPMLARDGIREYARTDDPGVLRDYLVVLAGLALAALERLDGDA